MTFWPLVRRLEQEGFRFALQDGRPRVAPASRMAMVDQEMLQSHRAELAEALLEDAQFLAQERAAILEFEAGFTRADAERLAGIHPPKGPLSILLAHLKTTLANGGRNV